MALHGQRVRRHFLAVTGRPVANHFGHFELGALDAIAEPVMAVTVHRVARHAAHFEQLALVANILLQPVSGHLAHLVLVFADLHHLVGVQKVVERHQHHALGVRLTDHAVKAGGRHGDGDDRVEALVDEVFDGAELCRGVSAGRDDLEFLQVGLHIRQFRVSLRGLDHLNAPGVAHEAVGQRNAIRALLGRPLEELRLLRGGQEAFRHRAGAVDGLGAGGLRPGGHQNGSADSSGDNRFGDLGHVPSVTAT